MSKGQITEIQIEKKHKSSPAHAGTCLKLRVCGEERMTPG